MKKRQIKRGDIYYANLYPIIGCEQDGIRPVVVIQNEMANVYSPVVLIAPLTSRVNTKPRLGTHVYIKKNGKITHDSIIQMEQIRVLDKSRLGSYICSLSTDVLQEIDKAIICSFQIDVVSYIANLIEKEEKNERYYDLYSTRSC